MVMDITTLMYLVLAEKICYTASSAILLIIAVVGYCGCRASTGLATANIYIDTLL